MGSFDSRFEWNFKMTFEEFQSAELTFLLLNDNKLSHLRKQPMSEYFMAWLGLYNDARG